MIDLRVDKGMMRIRECEGNTADLIYELTLIAGTLVRLARENGKPKMADLIIEWIKDEEYTKMVASMATDTLGIARVSKDTDSCMGWALIQSLMKEKDNAADRKP
jgi:hypothetical protein